MEPAGDENGWKIPGKEEAMDMNLIRLIAGALAVTIIGLIVWRRRRQSSE